MHKPSKVIANKSRKRRKHSRTNYRIGEASNPGPSDKNSQSKQRKLGYFFHQQHTTNDDKDEWCKEK
eukprot:1549872-Heterocapsa_arctica.AAC.1